ncbi:hypothetical protein N0V86_007882 [Didymella sp. IMI 355093]|nr:hypothetical protein N0V86_007882 [Didymella sp. IMI 355093]
MAPDESNVESPIDLASLQRELEALRAKVMVLEHDNKRYHSDEETDDEMLEFRAGDEVQMVDEAWSKWRMRREFASDIIRKADRMKQLRSQGKFIKAKQLDAEYNGNSYPPPPPPPPIRTIEMTEMSKLVPALHECTWTDFSGSTHLGKEIKQPKYVIDVLIGKPLVVWGRRGRLVDNSVAMQSDAPEPTARGSAQKAPAELPDRIRINSKLLLSVLGSSIFFPGMFGPFETVVFTSPFKILLHYQDDIRTSYEELLQKYAATSPVDKEDSTPIPIPAPVSTDISAEGDNGKPVTKINVVAQSCSQVSLEGNTEPVREEEAIHTELALQQLRVLIQFLDKVPLFAIEQTNEEVRREHQAGKVSDDEYLIMSDRVYAEGVAEAFEKPLLQITCGDLGFTAKEVEEALERNFELASRWDCVLLLDEADVFLASRAQAVTGADLNRNALVAVFLRVLEYYTGILFLTTNRIGDFDEAFASRIHVSLEYPQLTEESTQTILDLNIRLIKERFKKNGKAIAIDEDNIRFKISGYWHQNQHARLNGRQIRNACQTALALAEFDAQGGNHKRAPDVDAKVVLKSNYFDTVLRAYLDFNKYLKNIYGISPEERAREKGLRAGDTMDSNGGFSHSQSSNLGPSSPGFPGAHLYPQHVQPPSFNTNTNQPTALYQPHLQGHQSFQLPTQGQQMFMPVQSSTAVSPYQVPPPPHQDGQHLTNVKPEYDSGQASANTTAGHGIPIQVPPYNMVPGTQYHQPR